MQLTALLHQNFPYTPTPGQEVLFGKLAHFMGVQAKSRQVFILKGYAGTGKTAVLQALAKSMQQLKHKTLLLAPTGRAAKVLGRSAGQEAFTIHRQLYKPVQHPFSGQISTELRKNYHSYTLFIVDEASMVSAGSSSDEEGLLSDLIFFVFSKPGNALLLVGDPAQLPPVGEACSVGLETDVLRFAYELEVHEHTLTEVSRQQADSGILINATYLRECLQQRPAQLQLNTSGYSDVFQLPEERLLDALRYSFKLAGVGNTLLICATNEETIRLNKRIRQEVLGYTEGPREGEMLMIARNNYQSMPKESKLSYLANGEFVEVEQVLDEEERYGFRFMRLLLRLPDEPHEPAFESLILPETLESTHTSLPEARSRQLFEAVSRNYRFLNRARQVRALKKDPYLNALQVKHAYALTCHKAQGGQWDHVLLHAGFWLHEPNNTDKLRWLYTAITRASKALFILKPQL